MRDAAPAHPDQGVEEVGVITTYRELPATAYPGPDPAGEGKRRDKAAEKNDPQGWDRQVVTWGLPRHQPGLVRLWLVHVGVVGREKIERALPSGHRIRIFEGRVQARVRISDGWEEGPEFWLDYEDAEALWRDKDVTILPLCDRIEIASGAA